MKVMHFYMAYVGFTLKTRAHTYNWWLPTSTFGLKLATPVETRHVKCAGKYFTSICYNEDPIVSRLSSLHDCAVRRAEDCAVCTDGYASGSSYSCHECSGAAGRSATWLAALALVVAVVVLVGLVSDLVRVVDDNATRTVWGRRRSDCRRFVKKAFPLTAIKTVVVVWQIVTQVRTYRESVWTEHINFALRCVSGVG